VSDYHDLLDAIARVRDSTGDDRAWMAGLSADDIAVVTNPLSSSAAITAAVAKIRAAHAGIVSPTSVPGPYPGATSQSEGAAAEAIRTAESALAHQNSLTAQIDLQVVTAVLNAHARHSEGAAELDRLQTEIEAAVATRTDLDTAAGARGFQRYLIDKLRDIRTVVETADLDATSKATLAAALASLYASAAPASGEVAPPTERPSAAPESHRQITPDTPSPLSSHPPPAVSDLPAVSDPAPVDLGLEPPADSPPAPPVPSAAGLSPMGAGWGGGTPPAGMPFGGGLPTLPAAAVPDLPLGPAPDLVQQDAGDSPERAELAEDNTDADDDPSTVVLPDGQTVIAPNPRLAAVITAAVGGTPIAEAFDAQGITIPAPGTSVSAPLEPAQLSPGDIGLFTDRHALALGDGKALLDNRIQPVAGLPGLGFLGWQHPPEPDTDIPQEPPAPQPPGETVPGEA
jgi:hypothetical protein